MTNADLRKIVTDAAAGFGPAAAEEAYQAARSVPRSDDLPAYRSQVASAVEAVLEAAVAVGQADLRRSRRNEQIQVMTACALRQPITRWH